MNKKKNNIDFTPTKPIERNVQIDILRGFALFGVLIVNVFGYNSSFFDFNGFYNTFTDDLNSSVFSFVVNYGADKFIGLFSFLFGISFSILYTKYGFDEKRFSKFYTRRMLVLMAFGIIHIVFFWAGDILFAYSLLGILLLSLRKVSSKILLPAGIIIYFLPILYIALTVIFPFLPDALSSTSSIKLPEVINIYSNGEFSDVFFLRLKEYYAFRNINAFYYAPKILSLFILGYYFQKKDFITKVNSNKLKYFITAIGALIIGVLLVTYTTDIVDSIANSATNQYYTAIYMAVFEITNIFLITSYILLILILSQTNTIKSVLSPLQYIGRMSLTNYITFSVVFTSLMYSYGFGMFASFEPRQLIIIAVIFFIIQVILCKIWLQYFRYGPLEWIWRKYTYSNTGSLK